MLLSLHETMLSHPNSVPYSVGMWIRVAVSARVPLPSTWSLGTVTSSTGWTCARTTARCVLAAKCAAWTLNLSVPGGVITHARSIRAIHGVLKPASLISYL